MANRFTSRPLPTDEFAERLQAWIDAQGKYIEWGRYSWKGPAVPIDENDKLPF